MTPAFLFAFLCQAILPLWKCLERVCSVQQNAAGSLRVSPNSPGLSPRRDVRLRRNGCPGVESEFVSQPEESGLVLRKR